ncbi:glycosyltransferase [Rhizobium sp. 0TCS1.26]|uniref:glycosyltransferase n=1 Tax=Rhizobium sp. 0TCS1.26 TaxID=3142623 RepID=UPI003D28EEC0
MKVLHFFKTYWPDTFGGVERTIHAISRGTERHGIRSEVLSLSADPAKNSVALDGHMAHKAKLDLDIASTGLSREVFGHFRRLARDADIIHYHFPWPLMDIVHLTIGGGKPSVVTYHSDIVKQKTLLKLYQPLMNRFLGSVDRIVATSPNYLASSPVLQAFKDKVSIIPLGLDEAGYPTVREETRNRWRALLPPRFLVFVGVLRYYKGIDILIEAASQSGVDVVLIGDGHGEDYQAEAERRGIRNLHFLGSLPDEDKLAIIDLSVGLVFPSHLRSEAFGLSLVEAAMRARPMISCEIGTGTSFVNRDGETGIVIPPADPAALAAAMQRLFQDDGLANQYGRAARQRYLAMFTADRMADAYAELYRGMLDRHQTHG